MPVRKGVYIRLQILNFGPLSAHPTGVAMHVWQQPLQRLAESSWMKTLTSLQCEVSGRSRTTLDS